MQKLLQTSFVEQLRGREYSIEYFISHYDGSNQELIKECYEQLTLGEIQKLQLLVAAWKLDLKFYNLIDHMRAYNCLNALFYLFKKRISYIASCPKKLRQNGERRRQFELDERSRRVLEEEIYLRKKQKKAQETEKKLDDSY